MPEEQAKELKLQLSEEQYAMISEAVSRSKSNTHKINELAEKTELLMDMNKNIAVIAEQMKHTQEAIGCLKNDMEAIKDKPNKFLDNLKGVAAGAVITAVIGALLALVL